MSDPGAELKALSAYSGHDDASPAEGSMKSSMTTGSAVAAAGVRPPDFDADKLHPWAAQGPPLPDGTGLREQNLEKLDVAALTPLTPEIISRQATINIGTVGHVAHGKSTTVKALSGVKTVRFKDELAQNITIKLGYANAKIYRSSAPPYLYASGRSNSPDEYPMEDGTDRTMQLVRHISFVDCPGHDILMATMLNGAAVMDAAILLIAANEPCPQPQTQEHLAAVEIMQLDKIIVLQNKIDIVTREQAKEQYQQIRGFLDGGVAENAPILPVSAQLGYNVDLVCEYLARKVPLPVRNFTASPRMIVIRSFDVNRPGHRVEDMEGGVAGGSILRGVLKLGDEIEILPGLVRRDPTTKQNVCSPIMSTVVDLKAENNQLQYAVPGGLIGVGTNIDPTLTRADRLVGHVLGHRGNLPMVYEEIQVQYHLLRRLLGVRAAEGGDQKIRKLEKKESLMVNVGSKSTTGRVGKVKGDIATLSLTLPVCAEPGDKIALSRQVDKHWRLIGWGKITSGKTVEVRHLKSKAAAAGGGGGR